MHDIERSTEYFRFGRGEAAWRYTSAETDLDFDVDGTGAQHWRSVGISRSGFGQGPEHGRRTMEISVPPDLDLVSEFRAAPQPVPFAAAIWRSLDDPDGSPWVSLLWSGRLSQVVISDASARLVCEPILVSLRRTGLRRLISRQCTHVLYGAQCQAALLSVMRTVTQSSGAALSLDAPIDPGLYGGGYIERPDGRRAMIASATGLGVSLVYPEDVPAGEVIRIVAGCDHSLETCASRFANVANFGGFPWIPIRNPFQQTAY